MSILAYSLITIKFFILLLFIAGIYNHTFAFLAIPVAFVTGVFYNAMVLQYLKYEKPEMLDEFIGLTKDNK